MKMKNYTVRYETYAGEFEMDILADGYSSASDACYYEHCDEPGYKEMDIKKFQFIKGAN